MIRYTKAPGLTVVFATIVFSIASAAEQPGPVTSSQLGAWPCFGAAAHNFKADYTAYVGSHIDLVAHARCGAANSVATIDAGSLPPGLTLRGTDIVGVPQSPGDFYFSVKYIDPELMRHIPEKATFHVRIEEAPPAR